MRIRSTVLSLLVLVFTVPVMAQLPAPNDAGVSTGHVHFTVPNRARHAEIWKLLGAESGSSGSLQYLKVPGIFILLTEGEAQAPSIDTIANHVGFTVQDYELYKSRLLSVGASIFFDSPENGQILADLPDGIRIEILRDENQAEPIVFHHMHLATVDTEALREWYVKVFGAERSERRGLPSALVPGGRVDIMGATGGNAPRGSQGAALDHIGFEVADMDAFAEHLESLGIAFDREPRRVDAIGLTIAFLTDPDGTYIELTQGFADID